MSGRQQCPCRECSQSCHLSLKPDQAQTVTRIKLLEQAHCAFCWRPLQVSSAWPGPRTSWLPPADGDELSVIQCGHVFHSGCVHKQTHCRQCHVLITEVAPLHLVMEETFNEVEPPSSDLERRLSLVERELAMMRLDRKR